MENQMSLQVFSILFIGGVLADLILVKHSGDFAIWLMRTFKFGWANDKKYIFRSNSPIGKFLLNNAGEASSTTAEPAPAPVEIPKELQPVVDKVIQARIARERERFSDYEDLRKFKTEYERSQEQKTQEELIKQKKFEEVENTYKNKLNEFNQKLTVREQEIQNLKIEYALTNEVSKNNGFVEESIALLKNQVAVDKDGNLYMKTKDANGMDANVPLTEGVKKFYEQRPHLVKASFKQGGGTGAGDTSNSTSITGTARDGDLNYLNAELIKARGTGNNKQVQEIQGKIKNAMRAKGVSI